MLRIVVNAPHNCSHLRWIRISGLPDQKNKIKKPNLAQRVQNNKSRDSVDAYHADMLFYLQQQIPNHKRYRFPQKSLVSISHVLI